MTMPLEEIWKQLSTKKSFPLHQLIDAEHPLDLYAGIDTDGLLLFVLFSDHEPPSPEQSFEAFEVTRHHRNDDRWALTIKLTNIELSRLFGHLCDDLVTSSRRLQSQDTAGRFILDRIARWERLLARAKSSILDQAHIRGLIGELLYIEQIGIPQRGAIETIKGWQGPLGAAQDFRFGDCAVEVKTLPHRSSRTRISSAEQLDPPNLPLFLTAFALEISDRTMPAAFTLNELVERTRNRIAETGGDTTDFGARLQCTGYLRDAAYDETSMLVTGVAHYEVSESFPSIRRSRLADGIGAVRYDIDLAYCSTYAISHAN
jgi:hypothetical protein